MQGTLTGTVAAATVLVSATAPRGKAGQRLGTLQMVIFLAAAAGPFMGGLFAELVGIRASFGVTAALLFVSGVLVLFGVEGAEHAAEEDEGQADPAKPLPRMALALGLIPLFFVQLAITGVQPAMPGFVAELTGAASGIAGLSGQLLGAGALAAALGSLVGGRLAGRFGAQRVMILALFLAGLASLPQAAVTSIPELFALRVISSFALGTVIPVANLVVRGSVPAERQGEAFGITASATSVAIGLGPLGGGLLAASFGFGAPFLVPGILLLAASAALVVLVATATPRYVRLLKLVFASLVS